MLEAAVNLPTGPEQPTFGPGGKDYKHASFSVTQVGVSEERFVIFEPAAPTLASAPVVLFLHGWTASDPGYYIGWIEHLCRRGNIVIFPFYQGSGAHLSEYTLNAVRSFKEAVSVLYKGGHAEPDRTKVAYIGHECGGVIAMNIAATAKNYKVPAPGVLMILHPSLRGGYGPNLVIDVSDLSKIPSTAHLLVAVGEEDEDEIQETARKLYYAADSLASSNKNFLTYRSDIRGTPALVADSASVYTPREPIYERAIEQRRFEFVRLNKQTRLARFIRCKGNDAMDWLGNFRFFDALCDAAWNGRGRELTANDGEFFRFLGIWSDGRRIYGPLVSKRP